MSDVKRSIVLPEDMAQVMDRMAEEQDVSFSALVRRFVRQGLTLQPVSKRWTLGIGGGERKSIRGLCRALGMPPRECAMLALRKGIMLLVGEEGAP